MESSQNQGVLGIFPITVRNSMLRTCSPIHTSIHSEQEGMVGNQGNQHNHKTAASSHFGHVGSRPARKKQTPLKLMPLSDGLVDYVVVVSEISKLG